MHEKKSAELAALYEAIVQALHQRIYYLELYLYITLVCFLAYALLNLLTQWETRHISFICTGARALLRRLIKRKNSSKAGEDDEPRG